MCQFIFIFLFIFLSRRDAAGGSIQGDVQLLSAGYLLIIIYVALMLGNFTRLNIKVLDPTQWYKVEVSEWQGNGVLTNWSGP